MTTARIQFCLKGSGSWSYRIADQYVRLQVSKGIFRSLNSSKIHQDLSDSVCLIAENSVITQKHLLSRLELFIWPCGSESRNTVKGRVITFSSSCSLPVSKWGEELRIHTKSWRVSKSRLRILCCCLNSNSPVKRVLCPLEVLRWLLIALLSPAYDFKQGLHS